MDRTTRGGTNPRAWTLAAIAVASVLLSACAVPSQPAAVPTAPPTPRPSPHQSTASPPAEAPLTSSAAQRVQAILEQAIGHYRSVLQKGQSIISGFTPLANADAGLTALQDPRSVPSQLQQWRTANKVDSDTTYLTATKEASALYAGGMVVDGFDAWTNDMADAQGHLAAWANDVAGWLISDPSGAAMPADAATVTADLNQADKNVTVIVSESLAAPSATPSPTALPTPAPSGPSVSTVLTGYGALKADWDAHHQVDPASSDGSAFLPRNSDGSDRYVGVSYDTYGRVSMYQMYWDEPGISMGAARTLLLADLPRDAHVSFDLVKDTCEQIEYLSTTLGSIEAKHANGGIAGGVMVEFSSMINYSYNTFDKNQVTNVIVEAAQPGDQSLDC